MNALQISAGLKSGLFQQGAINISYHNQFEASIFGNIGGIEQTIKISGREHLNRATQGDIVVVELLQKNQWKKANESYVLEDDG